MSGTESHASGKSESRSTARLSLVPCNHYYLALYYGTGYVISICKRCKKRLKCADEMWVNMKANGYALDKPVRV